MNPPLRVANILFDDRYGGPQKRVIEVANCLRRENVETLLILPEGNGNAAAIARQAGVEVRRIRFHRPPRLRSPLRVMGYLLSQLPDAFRIARGLRQADVRIAHVNGGMFFAAGLAARLAGAKLVWHLNDTIVPGFLAFVAGCFAYRLSHRLIVASESVARHYGVAERRHQVIHAPVDVARYVPDAAPCDRNRDLRVGVVANWSPGKGIDDFVRAAGMVLREQSGNVCFEMAGARLDNHAAYADAVERSIRELRLGDRLRHHGFIDDSSTLIRGLDILVLSSHSEACPMVVLEAMASGVAVVATDVGGAHELLIGGDRPAAGHIVPVKSPRQIARALVALLNDGETRRQLGAAGVARAREQFSLEVCFGRHLEIYRSLA